MTPTQRFYFKLINALLDAAGDFIKTCNRCKPLDWASKGERKFNPVSAYGSAIETCVRDALMLIASGVNVYGEELGLSGCAAANT